MWQFSVIGIINICNSFLIAGLLIIMFRTIQHDARTFSFSLFLIAAFMHTLFYALSRLSTNTALAFLFFKLCTVAAIALIATLMHFVHILLGIHRKKIKLLIVTDLLNASFAYVVLGPIYIDFVEKFGWGLWPIPRKPLLSVYLFWWFFQVIYCLYLLYKKGVMENTGREKLAYKQMLIAFAIGWAGGSTPWFLWYDIPCPPYFNAAIAIFAIWIAYTVFRHRLFDIEIIIRKTAMFTGLWVVAGILVCGISMLTLPVFQRVGIPSIATTFLSFAVFITLFRKTEVVLEHITDKWLFHKRINYETLLTSLGDMLTKINELEPLCETLSALMIETLPIAYFHIYVYDDEEECYVLMTQNDDENPFPLAYDTDTPLLAPLSTLNSVIADDFATKKKMKEMLVYLRTSLLIPLRSARRLIGFIIIGNKLSDQEYTKEDIRAFKTMQASLTTAIENALAFEKLKNSQIELAQKEKLATIGTLAAGIKHEINNPLFVILGRAEMISRHGMLRKKSDWDREKLIDYIERQLTSIKFNAERIKEIVERLSDFSKPIDTADMQTVFVRHTVDDSIKLLGYDSRQMMHISFCITLEDSLMVMADSRMLVQVFFNLINNAIHAMNFQGEITISSTVTPYHAYIHVRDTGEGIEGKNLSRIFDPFFTTKDTTQSNQSDIKGTGLGLHLVYNYLKKMNGDITVESEIGHGSTFTIILEKPAPS